MKTKQLFAGLLLVTGILTSNAQSIVETIALTSGGLNAGTGGSSSTYYGYETGAVSTATDCTFIGSSAGKSNAFQGWGNTFTGANAGYNNTTGNQNTFMGNLAGFKNTTGGSNIFIGPNSGNSNTTGSANVAIGNGAGYYTTTGRSNTYIGNGAGNGSSLNGSNNVYLGNQAGFNSNGSRNVFIGNGVGHSVVGDDLLLIENTNVSTPLIWGDFATDLLKLNAKVGIGGVTTFPTTAGGVNVSTYKLFVNGGILATEVRVATTWADYVFADDYTLRPLEEVENFIATNGHLPNVPSAKQVEEEGISVGEMAKIQQEKIEELTLYLIQQKKEIEELKAQMKLVIEQKR